jgi:DNA-binding NarL/FixJ family response regulator
VPAACSGIERRETEAPRNARSDDVCDHRGMRPTVLIVDDHAAFRESASAFEVVGVAADGPAAIIAAARLRPQVVLLDVRLPGQDGFEVAQLLSASPEPPAVVLISSRDASTYGARLAAAPVKGFIAKRELSGATLAALVD